jgi:hypothetical protein
LTRVRFYGFFPFVPHGISEKRSKEEDRVDALAQHRLNRDSQAPEAPAARRGHTDVCMSVSGEGREPPLGRDQRTRDAYGLREWPERAGLAAKLIAALPLQPGDTLLDLGCGQQTIRKLAPPRLRYVPVDRLSRTEDTLVLDLDSDFPRGHFAVAVMLGLLEYLQEPLAFLSRVAGRARFSVFSVCDFSDKARWDRHGWVQPIPFDLLEDHLHGDGGRILEVVRWKKGTRLYAVAFPDPADLRP